MPYGSIIELIDSELERLGAAREILAGLPGQIPPVARRRARTPQPPDEISTAPAPVPEPVPDAAAPVVAVTRVRAPAERKPRQRRPRPVEPRALTSTIPAGPVVVSREMLAQRRPAPVPDAAGPKQEPTHEGSLEALVRDLQARSVAALTS